ncbi:MAG: regulatory protein RecX [Flavobacteriales bacterium]
MLSEILQKVRRWCAVQERCQQEARDKFYTWGLHREQVEQAIVQLIGEGFLNEARFAEHYAVSKFRQKGWGKAKIKAALEAKRVSGPCIVLGLKAIDTEEYAIGLDTAVRKTWAKYRAHTGFERVQRVKRYLIGKGFDADAISTALRAIVTDH